MQVWRKGPRKRILLTCNFRRDHGDRRPPFNTAARREAFQTSPQSLHRQYARSSVLRAVVVMAGD